MDCFDCDLTEDQEMQLAFEAQESIAEQELEDPALRDEFGNVIVYASDCQPDDDQ